MNYSFAGPMIFFVIFWIFVGCYLETCIPGVGYYDAVKSKIACEKSLPRDQVCIANYVPKQGKEK